MRLKRLLLVSASVALVGSGLLVPGRVAEAQYFGQNKVQYERLDFEVLKTEHFDIYYYPEEQVAVEFAALMAERWYARLSRLLNHDLSGRQALILYASGPHFRQTNTLQGDIGESTGGVTEILKRRIVLPFSGPLPETDHVLGHELVHAFQFDITGEGGGIARSGVPTVMRYPLWFVEGMAEYLSVGHRDANTAMWMRDAVRIQLPTIEKLGDPRFFPYRYGQSLWAYIAGRWGDDIVGRLLKASRAAGGPQIAFARVLRMPGDSVVVGWHRALRSHYEPLLDVTGRAADYGRPLITPLSSGGRVNIAPSISPDGSKIVFLSERDLFSIDMFVADAWTGEVIGKLTRTDVDPHFESLQFINSAGAWDYEGRRFAFGAIAKGRPVLTIIDIERNRKEREIKFPDLNEVYTPSWSPDGRYIAFSGLAGGLLDLFVYDLQEDVLKRLTNDAYADLQPAWSPDGSQIAFVTDRFSTGLSSLLYGNYRLALLDPNTAGIRPVQGFGEGKNINPQWSPDGQSLYFVSDQNGISNVYRLELATGELYQLTNLYTGVSGITALSPTMSVAALTGEVAVSVYEEDVNAIYLLDQPDVLAGGPVLPPFAIDPGILPPAERLTDDVASLISNAFYGLPRDQASFDFADYKPRFALDYIGQPSLAVGADRFGTYIAGGASLFWSDMLGGHNLATALEIRGSLKDIGALVGYTNLTRRLNWGVTLQQAPFLTGQVSFADGIGGTLVERTFLLRQTQRQLSGVVAYPLNRAQRVEANARYLNVTYDAEEQFRIFTPEGFLVDEFEQDAELPEQYRTLNLGNASLALVYDNSLFGITSPMLGLRYRIEAAGSIGTLDYGSALVDIRKYFMPARPWTIAFRLLHSGRYGPDSDDLALQPYYIGYDGLVRGYDYGSFNFSQECGVNADGLVVCPTYDNMFGSKMLLANVEIRFPPLGVLGLGSGLFGYLPIEAYIFGDAGMAWYGEDQTLLTPSFDDRPFWVTGGQSRPAFAAGGGLRMNFFGFMIMGVHYVYPFNRVRGGHLQFTFVPGF
jgi:Tol biopolymer transport system component